MMLQVRRMTAEDQLYVMPCVEQFYHSEAVDHTVPTRILRQTFAQAVSNDPVIEGYLLYDGEQRVGYAYVTHMYASEAGPCLMVEELYLEPFARGRGLGRAFFDWLFAAYPNVVRFRLEVTPENISACALYQKMGFVPLHYNQMIREA